MKNKVLLASSEQSIFTQPCLKYLKSLGYQVDFFDISKDFLTSHKVINKLLSKVPRIKNIVKDRADCSLSQNLLNRVNTFKPDYLLVIKGKNFKFETFKQINQLGVKTINWFPDATTNWVSIEQLAPLFDYFFTYDPYILKRLREKGLTNCYYLPFAAELDKDAQYPSQKDYQYDISFIGSYEPGLYDARVTYLSKLKDLDLHIWGNKNWLRTPLVKFYHGWSKNEEILEIYKKSKIVVNIDQQIPEEEGLNVRPFEVTAAGSFLLNDPIKDDIYRLFEEGKEVIVFKDGDDLRAKVEYYLSHNKERERIAQAGFERTKREHTYIDRFNEMFKIINLELLSLERKGDN